MKIGKRIRQLRIENNVSQEELANKLHIDRTTLSGYETEKRTPDIETACHIANYFNVTLDFLVGMDFK